MPSDYPSTSVPFETYALPDLHDPIAAGPGFGGVEDAASVYAQMAATLEKAAGDLRAVLNAAQGAHEGEAAEESRRHIARIAAAGEEGAAQAKLAMNALQEQASYFFQVRMDMKAAADVDAQPGPMQRTGREFVPTSNTEDARVVAADAAIRYQANTNHNLAQLFQVFVPPAESGLDVRPIEVPQGPAWGGGVPSTVSPASPGVLPHGGAVPGSGPATSAALGSPPVGAAAVAGAAPASGLDGAGSQGPLVPAGALPGVAAGGATADAGRGGSSLPRADPPGTAPSVLPAGVLPPLSGGRSGPGSAGSVGPGSVGPGSAGPNASPGWTAAEPLPGLPRPESAAGPFLAGGPWPGGGATPGNTGGAISGGTVSGGTASEGRSPAGRGPLPGEPMPPGAAQQRPGSAGHAMPFLPGTAGGRGQDSEHARPAWLVEDDPEAIWMSGLPAHGPAVIEPVED